MVRSPNMSMLNIEIIRYEAEEIANLVIGNVEVPSPEGLLDASMANGIIASWVDGVRAVKVAADLATCGLPVGHNGQMSMIREGTKPVLVTWDVHGRQSYMGRRVKIDNRNRAIWVIPGLTPAVSFENYKILCPAIGLRLERVKQGERSALPEACLRFFSMALSLVILKMPQFVFKYVVIDVAMVVKSITRANLTLMPLYNYRIRFLRDLGACR